MEYIGFVFGIFGLLAYCEISSLKRRISDLERSLTAMQGTSYHEDRTALVRATREYICRQVNIDLLEDHADTDIIMYGNSRHGTNTILDADNEWLLVQIDSPGKSTTKLIRMESVERISLITEQ